MPDTSTVGSVVLEACAKAAYNADRHTLRLPARSWEKLHPITQDTYRTITAAVLTEFLGHAGEVPT